MKLSAVEIKGMWGKIDLRWELDPSVNILTGINGAGKSTIMDFIAEVIMTNSLKKESVTKVKRINVEFDNKKDTLVCLSFNDTMLNLKKEAESNRVYRELWEDVSRSVSITKDRQQRLNRMGITASVSYLVRGKQLLPLSDKMIDGLNVDIISTFDSTLPGNYEQSRMDTLKKQGVRSTLDMELHLLQEQYAYYLGGLATMMEQHLKEGKPVDKEFVDNLYAPKNLFIKIVNELFSQTGKHINIDNSRLEFVIDDEDKHISMYDLSSGEKQLIYILLTVLLEGGKDYILFMDEPEISLHVDWQECLIEKIQLLNPNCQMLIATHAPSLLLGGWNSFVKNIDDLKSYESAR